MITKYIRHSIPMAAHVKAHTIELEAHGINSRLSLVVHGPMLARGCPRRKASSCSENIMQPGMLRFDSKPGQQADRNCGCHYVHHDHRPEDGQIHPWSWKRTVERQDGIKK